MIRKVRDRVVLLRLIKVILTILLIDAIDHCVRAEVIETATIDRLLQRENIHNVVIDDKRRVVYFEKITAKANSPARFPYASPFSVNSALKKIYVASMSGGAQAKPLFRQAEDTGYYFASADPWSPDRRYLAVYRFKEGKAQPGVFDLKRSRVQFFDVVARFEPFNSSLIWIRDTEFVFFKDDEMKTIGGFDIVSSARLLAGAREGGWRDGMVTSEIVGSGKYYRRRAPQSYELVSVNIITGKVKYLSRGIIPQLFAPTITKRTGVMREWRNGVVEVSSRWPRTQHRVLSSINLHSGDKASISHTACGGDGRPLKWSSSGKFILTECITEVTTAKKRERTYSLVDVERAEIIESLPPDASNFAWVGDRLVYSLTDEQEITDYNNAHDEVAVRVVTPSPVASSTSAYFYLNGGDLWRAELGAIPENVTRNVPEEISLYTNYFRYGLQPTNSHTIYHTPSIDKVLFETDIGGRRALLVFSEDGAVMSTMFFPHPDSVLLAATTQGAVFLTNQYGIGSQLHYVSVGGGAEPRALYRFNEQLAKVTPAAGPIRIEHKGFDGLKVTGWLYLPPGASLENPQKYPLVVVQYPSLIYNDEPPNNWRSSDSIWNLDLGANVSMEVFAAQGYAVLLPSIPLGPEGRAGEPMTRIMPAISSALDSAIETGFVDSTRLALTGQSLGGFGALSVAVQTDRFQAIIAMASLSNLISNYGIFRPRAKINGDRFITPGLPNAHFWSAAAERMGAAPWAEPTRFIKNSPLFHVDKVTTPIMLVHGDLDDRASILQAEEMFTGLFMEHQDALFVKYLGEQHTLELPQNQEDMWLRIFSFLDDNGVYAN